MIINNNIPESQSTPSSRISRRNKRTQEKSTIVSNKPCPTCREKGGDSTGNHMIVFDTGKGYCSRCTKHFSKEEVESSADKRTSRRAPRNTTYQQSYQKKLTIDDIAYFGFLGDKHRGITPDADRHFGIKTEVSEGNRKPLKRYYPYYVEDELYGYKVRTLPKDWDGAIGTIAGTDLFGWVQCTGSRRTLIIVEGEEDCAAGWLLWKTMNARSQDRRIKNGACHIISLPNGAKGCLKALMHHIEDLMKYEKIIWMGDNYHIDSEGALALEQAVQVLGVSKLFVGEYPDRKKDLCDILKLGINEATDIFAEMYFNCKVYRPANIVNGADVTLDDIEKEPIVGYSLPYPCLQDPMKGMRLYEHTVFTASAGSGKSSLITAIAHHMSREHGWMVGNIFLEEKEEKSQQRYIAYDNNVALDRYREDYSCIPRDLKVKTVKELINNMYFLDHSGSIESDELMNKIRYMVNSGCKLIILDHLTLVVTGSDDERSQLDELMEKIYRYVEHTPVHILSVVHISRGDPKKDPSMGADITPNHLRGSNGIIQMGFNVAALEGWNEDPDYGNTRFIRWLKVRETGNLGLTKGALVYDQVTGKFNYDASISKKDVSKAIKDRDQEENTSYSNKPKMGGGSYDNRAS